MMILPVTIGIALYSWLKGSAGGASLLANIGGAIGIKTGTVALGPSIANLEAAAYAQAVSLVKAREGTKTNSAGQFITYNDSLGKLTGGYGHLIKWSDNAAYKKLGAVIPESQVNAWFKTDIADAFAKGKAQAKEINKYTPAMIAALTSANFQLGDFKSVFANTFAVLKSGDISRFISRILVSPWAKQTPVRVADLIQTVKNEYGVA